MRIHYLQICLSTRSRTATNFLLSVFSLSANAVQVHSVSWGAVVQLQARDQKTKRRGLDSGLLMNKRQGAALLGEEEMPI